MSNRRVRVLAGIDPWDSERPWLRWPAFDGATPSVTPTQAPVGPTSRGGGGDRFGGERSGRQGVRVVEAPAFVLAVGDTY